jgi:ABC-2 type transport system ATP-binding protein
MRGVMSTERAAVAERRTGVDPGVGAPRLGPTIELQALGKTFGPTEALHDLTATVLPGRVTAFLGSNGAGKTTTLRLLLGLIAPTTGTATFDGRPYGELPHPVHVVGALLETSGFHPGRTAYDHLRAVAVAARLPAAAAARALAAVDLTADRDRRVGTFSLGMRQRLGLATALLADPPALVLDEPTNGLDPQGIRWLRARLRDLAAEGRTVLLSSHLLSEVEQVADDILVIAHGRLVTSTTLAALRVEAGTGCRVRTADADQLAALLTTAGHGVGRLAPDELSADTSPERVGALAAAHGIVLHRLGEARTLEETLLRLTQEVVA